MKTTDTPHLFNIMATLLFVALSPTLTLAQQVTGEEVEEDELAELSPFEVDASRDRGYGSTATLGGTRMNVDLLNTPQGVSVINREIIDDLGTTNMASQAAIFAAGVSKRGRNSGNTNLTIRGSDAGQLAFIDGLPAGTSGEMASGLDPIGTERIEFVKGPVGALYGSHDGQGIQNRVTKKPLGINRTTFKFIAGSDDLYRGEIDTSGSFFEKKLGYRIAGAFQQSESKTGAPNDRTAFYSYLNYDISEESKTWFRFEFVDFEAESATSSFRAAPPDPGNPLIDRTGIGFIPIDIAGGGLEFSLNDRDALTAEWGYQSQFFVGDSRWTLKTVGRFGRMDFNLIEFIGGTFNFIDAGGNIIGNQNTIAWQNPNWVDVRVDGTLNNTVREQSQAGAFLDLAGDFKIGPTAHKMLLYTSIERNETDLNHRIRYDLEDIPFFDGADLPTPGRFQLTGLPPAFGNPRVNRNDIESSTIFGAGIVENMRLLEESLIFVGGAGFRSGNASEKDLLSGDSVVDQSNSDWVFQYGVVAKPFQLWNLGVTGIEEGPAFYFNHGETFIPLAGFDDLGNPLKNRELESDEVGMKLNLFNSRVVSTVTYFDTTENGFVIRILDDMGQQQNIQGGILTTDGWEFELALQPTDNLSAFVAFSDFDHEDANGDFVRAVPLGSKWSFITKYEFLEGFAEGLSLGLTFERTPRRMGDSNNSFLLPSFDIWGAFASYRWNENWKLQINVNNLTDDEFVLGSANRSRIFFGDDRTFRVTLNYQL